MKREYIIVCIAVIFIFLNLYLIVNPDFSTILGAATSTATTVTLEVVSRQTGVVVPASGNVTFSTAAINQRITKITGLTPDWEVNITLYGNVTPQNWTTEKEDDVGTGIEFLEIAVNANSSGGNYYIYFNITNNERDNIDEHDIQLFRFNADNGNFDERETTVVNSTTSQLQFYARTKQFSKFIISGKKKVGTTDADGEQVPDSGNFTSNNTKIITLIPKISSCESGWNLNITIFGATFPDNFTRAPNSSEIGFKKFRYFEIDVNATTAGGSYNIYFNLTNISLGNTSIHNVSMFIYETTNSRWENLSTTILNNTNDPLEFFATTTHFSEFLIGQLPSQGSGSGGSGGSPGPSGPSGGAGGGGSGRAAIAVPPPITGRALADVILKNRGLKPLHLPGDLFDVSVLIPEKYQQLFSLQKLLAEISIINIKRRGQTAVKVEYSIDDANENQLWTALETKVIESEISYLKEIILPPDIASGVYLLKVRILFSNDVAIAAFPFTVIDRPPALYIPPSWWKFIIPSLIIIIIISIWLLFRWRQKKKLPPHQKQRQSPKLPLLKDKYNLGLIPRGVYKQQSGEIKRIHKK